MEWSKEMHATMNRIVDALVDSDLNHDEGEGVVMLCLAIKLYSQAFEIEADYVRDCMVRTADAMNRRS